MATLCIRIAPNNNPTDAKLDALRTQIGDVVCIVEDGHKFSSGELNCGQYKFVDVPGVPQVDLIYLIDSVEDADGQMIMRRAKTLDVEKLDSLAFAREGRNAVTKSQIESLTLSKAIV